MLRALRGPAVFDARCRWRGARETRCATTARRGLVSAWRPWFHHAGCFACSRCPSCRARSIAPVWLRRAARRSDFVESLLMTVSRDAPPTWGDDSATLARRHDLGPVSPQASPPRALHSGRDPPICVRARSCCREAQRTAARPDSSMAAGEPHDPPLRRCAPWTALRCSAGSASRARDGERAKPVGRSPKDTPRARRRSSGRPRRHRPGRLVRSRLSDTCPPRHRDERDHRARTSSPSRPCLPSPAWPRAPPQQGTAEDVVVDLQTNGRRSAAVVGG